MRILAVFSTDHLLGGGEVSFTLTLRAVRAAGHEVLALIPARGPICAYLDENGIRFEVARQETLRNPSRLTRLLWPGPDWTRIVTEFQPDLIHCNAIRSALYGQAVGRRFGIPTILHARKEMSDPTDMFLMATLDGIVCISEVVRKRFATRRGKAILWVVYNTVELPEQQKAPAHASELRAKWLGEKGGFLIGLPGRLSPIKGQQRVVRAATRVLRSCPAVRFVFIGERDASFPDFRSELEQEIGANGLEQHFVFAGFERDMASAYHALDVVVFPTSSEAFGRIAIEAGAARIPLIANDIDVMREILPSPPADFVVNCDDADAFADRMVQALLQPEWLARCVNRLYDHVRDKFGVAAHGDAILRVYEEILEHRRGVK